MVAVPTLSKAYLQEISSDENPRELGPEVAVQFNPATLRLRMNNSIGDGRSRGLQRRQYMGQSSTVLSMELIFDTSDDGSSVRKKTEIVEKFVLPRSTGREAPPKLRFHWGVFVFEGLVEEVSIDLEYFAPNGTPLRAKVSLSIKEQDARFQFPKDAQAYGAVTPEKRWGSPRLPGSSAGGGGQTGAAGTNVVRALAGESAPELAARLGLDPAAWRGLGVDLSGGLELKAGAEVSFTAGASAGAGLGLKTGINAGMGVSLEASLGLETAAALPAGREDGAAAADRGRAAGLAISAAGGVRAALESVAVSKTEAACETARAEFASTPVQDPLAAAPSRPSPGSVRPGEWGSQPRNYAAGDPGPEQPQTPLTESGLPSPAQQASAKPAPVGPWADRRATTFGYGVPLRATIPVAARRTRSVVHTPYASAEGLSEMPRVRDNPTVPSWEQLPREGSGGDRENGSRGSAASPSGPRPGPCPCGSGGRL
jgi:hypothetical protein